MRIPKERMRLARSYEGQAEPAGFLVIDIKGLDIEGVNSLVLDIREVEKVKAAGDKQDEAKERAKKLLGG